MLQCLVFRTLAWAGTRFSCGLGSGAPGKMSADLINLYVHQGMDLGPMGLIYQVQGTTRFYQWKPSLSRGCLYSPQTTLALLELGDSVEEPVLPQQGKKLIFHPQNFR